MTTLSIARLAGKLLAAATVLCAASSAHARPDTRTMTCAETQALIKSDHAVVLTTGPDTYVTASCGNSAMSATGPKCL